MLAGLKVVGRDRYVGSTKFAHIGKFENNTALIPLNYILETGKFKEQSKGC